MGALKVLNKVWYYALFLIAAFPLLRLKLTSLAIIITSILTIIIIIIDKKNTFKKAHLKWLLLFLSLYIAYLISSLFYPFDRGSGFVLEKKMSLFIFPIILFLIPKNINKDYFKKLLLTFALVTLGITLVTNCTILITGIPLKYSLIADFSYSYRTYFESLSRIHPTYLSLYLAFAALILVDFALKSKKNRIYYLLAFFICMAAMVPLAAKLPILGFIISLGLYFLIQPLIWKKIKYYFLFFIVASAIGVFTIPSLTIRTSEIISSSFSPPQGGGYNSINVRSGIWECSIDLIKEHWLTGVGASNLQKQLNNCYEKFDTNAYDSVDYNTHNEYFNILLGIGILGLILFLLLLLLLSYYAFKEKQALFFSFIILISLCFSTENILERQGGIVFFMFFSTLFTRMYLLQKKVG